MSSLNQATLIGNLGNDPDVNYTQSNTAVANLSLATNERYKDRNGEYQEKVEWHRVVLWGRQAEIAQQYLRKGSKVYIEGSLQTREWQDKEGVTRQTTEIKAFKMLMLDSKDSGQDARPAAGQQRTTSPRPNQPAPEGVELDNRFDDMDDDLPF